MSLATATQRVSSATDPAWREAAKQTVKRLAQSRSEFTTDDVWDALAAMPVATPEHRALGPIMNWAVKEGLVSRLTCNTCGTTKVMRLSERPEAHQMDVAVYTSLV